MLAWHLDVAAESDPTRNNDGVGGLAWDSVCAGIDDGVGARSEDDGDEQSIITVTALPSKVTSSMFDNTAHTSSLVLLAHP